MDEREQTDGPDVQGEPGGGTIPADQTVDGLGDVEIGGETEEDAPAGGGAPAAGGQPAE